MLCIFAYCVICFDINQLVYAEFDVSVHGIDNYMTFMTISLAYQPVVKYLQAV